MRRILAPTLLAGVAGLAVACERGGPVGEGGGAALMRNLLRAREIEFVASDGPLAEACQKAADLVARERNVACSVRAPAGAGDGSKPRIVVAAAAKEIDPLVRRVFDRIGIAVDASKPSFTFLRTEFDGASDALAAVVEDPERPGLPLTLLYGNDAGLLARAAAGIDAGWKPWLRIYRAGALSLEGPLWNDGEPRAAAFEDHEGRRTRTYSTYRVSDSPDPTIRVKAATGIEPSRRDAYLESVGRAKRGVLAWASGAATPGAPPIELVLHARSERLFEFGSAPALSIANRAQRKAHVLVAADLPDDSGEAFARLFAEDLLGPASEAWIDDGAAVLAAGRWWGRDLEEWIAWLRLGGFVPGVDALVDPDATRANSRHLVLPLRAALFRFVLESQGEAFARSLWKGSVTLARGTETERAFQQWLDEIAGRHRAAIEKQRAERRKSGVLDGFLAAVGIEESGAGAERGFGSEVFERSLADAREIGARAVFLTCFLALDRDPLPIADLESRLRDFEPFESDARVFAGLARARADGMRAFLQPRLLTGPAGTLAGTDPQGNEMGWRKFYDAYSRFAIHVGLLAELAGADGLVLGGGMTASTNGVVGERAGPEEQVAWKKEGWDKVLRAARGAFAGSLTWAADSVTDAWVLSFWKDLDAVGCDLEPAIDRAIASYDPIPGGPSSGGPTSGGPKPGVLAQRRIGEAITELETLAASIGKPLILTRAGFRAGISRPSRPALARPGADPGMQALEFEVLGAELRRAKPHGTLRGAVLWRWSSDPDDVGTTEGDVLIRRGLAREAAARALAGL